MMKEPLSECMNAGILNLKKCLPKHLMMDEAVMPGQTNAKGKQEYSFMIVNRNLFFLLIGSGPLKSIVNLKRFGCLD